MLKPDLTWRDKALIYGLGALVLLIVGYFIYFHFETIGALRLDARLRAEGLSVNGIVTELERRTSSRSFDSCMVEVGYQVDGQTYTLEQRTTEDFCSIFRVGSRTELLYLSGSPERTRLSWGGVEELNLFLIVLVDIFFVIAGARIVYKARKEQAEMEAAKDLRRLREENGKLEQGANDAPEIR